MYLPTKKQNVQLIGSFLWPCHTSEKVGRSTGFVSKHFGIKAAIDAGQSFGGVGLFPANT